jgi:thiamine-monophosphate kinase
MSGADEFEWIARLRPLTRGAAEAFNLLDDAAAIPSRPGHDLVITKDAHVEGVHVLMGEDRAIIARRLLRTNLSDLAAKAAEPFGYLLMIAWPHGHSIAEEEAFVRGLEEDGQRFGLTLLGGDTVATDGPLTVSATMLGWTAAGAMVTRSGARPGDVIMTTGTIGDGWLGLQAARGEIDDADGSLAGRFRLPEPRLVLRDALREHAAAAADVSDGLLADVLHIAEASGCEARIELERVPVSPAARAWIGRQEGELSAIVDLATGGDDYELVCAVRPEKAAAFAEACAAADVPATTIGRFAAGGGIRLTYEGYNCAVSSLGWRHR